jgi:signal transduction histidine kinase/DNA-binding response OmpR family regulator
MLEKLKISGQYKKIRICFQACLLGTFIISANSYSEILNEYSSSDFSYSMRHLSEEDGLPSNIITGIIKDNKGFMWFSTPNGLCRWDGFRTIPYQHQEADSNSLIGNRISRNGMIWDEFSQKLIIGTKEGISIFDSEKGNFENFYVDPSDLSSIPAPVNTVFLDRQGILWAGTDSGFSYFNPASMKFINFYFNQNIPPDVILDRNSTNMIITIRQDINNDSILWLASLAGLLKFNKQTEELTWFYFPDKDYLREINQFTLIVSHPDGKLYLGTWNFDMIVFDTKTEKFTSRFGPASKGNYFLSNRTLPYAISPDKKIWVSSLEGLGILDIRTIKINFIHSFKNENGHRFAPELFFTDDNGSLWLGSEYGVFILKQDNQPVYNYSFDPKDEDHWYLTLTLFEDTLHNELLIGYGRGEGLHRYNMKTNRFGIIPYPQRIISECNILSFLQTQSGNLYFITTDEIYQYYSDDKKITALDFPYENFPAFNDIKEDSKGGIWVASGNLGLQQYDPQKNTVKDIRNWSNYFTSGHALPLFAELCIDPENRVWFRRRGESYGYYDPQTDSLHYFNKEIEKFDLTCFGDVIGDSIWVATAKNGLGIINIKDPDLGVKLIHILDTIETGIIQDMAFDKRNRLWCLTEKGLIRVNTKTGESALFDENYGIAIRDVWSNKNTLIPGQLKLLSDGRMVIGYRHGLGFFHPDSMKVIYTTPEPYFTTISVFNNQIDTEGQQTLKLAYDENYLTFCFSALDLYNVGTSFRYKLSGIDQDWHPDLVAGEVAYLNLQPGSYQFIVQTISKSGYGQIKELVFNFRILPPWWQTTGAYTIILILFTAIIFLVYRFQLKRQLAHREARRLRELDELKTRLYTNITHEFRTPITVIMGLAEELSDSFDAIEKKYFRKKLETIQRSGANLLRLVNQMLDLAKLEHGKFSYKPICNNIIPWLQYIVESHQSLAAVKDIQLTLYPETESLEMDYDPDQLSKVISNLLTNAIKFTPYRGKVICHVKFETASNKFIIKVKDSGLGIPESEQSKIFYRFYQVESSAKQHSGGTGIGLSLTKEIVERIGGTISVISQEGKGSEFEVILPVTRNAKETSINLATIEKPLIQKVNLDAENEEEISESSNGYEKPLVLIAEDNPDVAGYIRDTIRLQYKVKWASDGEKALQMAFDLIPDLVITDVMMPGKDGLEVCNILKYDQRTDHIPVIMLTAKVTDNDRITGYERGADAYLTKPFNKKELLVRLEQLLKLRRQLQAKFSKMDLKTESDKPLNPKEQFIRKAAQIVEANLEKSIFNATDLADKVNLSESQLYRKLKAISGKSTAIFIRTVRLTKSKELLEISNLSISEIAYQVGFNDPAWFSRVFKEEYGISPTEARAKR